MSRWHHVLRRVLGHDDRVLAYGEERRALEDATRPPGVPRAFAAEMDTLHGHPDAIALGTSAVDPDVPAALSTDDLLGRTHALILGGSGSGKSYLAASVVRTLLARLLEEPDAPLVWVIDHKSELVTLVRAMLVELLAEASAQAREHFLEHLVVLDPFADALVPFDVLAPQAGVEPEVQAYEVATLLERLGGADLGVKQDSFVFHLMLLGITTGRTLVDLEDLVADPDALAAAALGSPSRAVRRFFAGGLKLSAASRDGVASRLGKLLRLASMRRQLGARGQCVDFRELLRTSVVLIDVGSPPLGCEDLARFWASLYTLKLTRGLFARTPEEARRPVLIAVDEWQEGLLSGGDVAEQYERSLSQARSRGVSFVLISQSLAGAAKVSPALPKVVQTNTNVQFLFRASPEDGRTMAGMLPVTGRKPRDPGAPWEREARHPFLTVNEEREALVAGVATLPDRTFYYWNRTRAHGAVLCRSLDVSIERPAFVPTSLTTRVRQGALARSVEELDALAAGDDDGFRPVPVAPLPVRRRPRG